MVKRILLFCSLTAIYFSVDAQTESYSGTYTYSASHYNESLNLEQNGSFKWSMFMHMGVKMNIEGNWQVRNDSLILDSYPQREKLIVNESKEGKLDTYKISVRDKNLSLFNFHLTAIMEKGDTLFLRDQWEESTIHGHIKGFYITNTTGLRSPYYRIQGKTVNRFNVLFEHIRVFENEIWIIKNNEITPRGLNGEVQRYTLKRN